MAKELLQLPPEIRDLQFVIPKIEASKILRSSMGLLTLVQNKQSITSLRQADISKFPALDIAHHKSGLAKLVLSTMNPGGAHSYHNVRLPIATINRDNIQEYSPPAPQQNSTKENSITQDKECLGLAESRCKQQPNAFSIWKELSLPALTKTRMILELADRTISTPTGIAEDVFVKVGTFFFPADFVVVDYVADPRARMTKSDDLKVGDTKTFSYNIIESVNRVDVIDIACEEYVQEVLEISESGNPTPTSNHMNDSRSPSFTPFGGIDFF
ncbi:hypothetical protein Tco_0336515 [Tanacetum coccineum]